MAETANARVTLRVAVQRDDYDEFREFYPEHGMTSIVLNRLIKDHLKQLRDAKRDGKLVTPLPVSSEALAS